MEPSGVTDLGKLIKFMNPILHDETFVFGHIPAKSETDYQNSLKLVASLPQVQMLFREAEGWTVILPESVAQEIQLKSTFPCKKCELRVHSSLDAVGFMAAITTRLAKDVGVGVNPVSGYFHDHLFVPVGKEDVVMEVLRKMASEGS